MKKGGGKEGFGSNGDRRRWRENNGVRKKKGKNKKRKEKKRKEKRKGKNLKKLETQGKPMEEWRSGSGV